MKRLALILILLPCLAEPKQMPLGDGGGGGTPPCAGMEDPDGPLDFGAHVAFVVGRSPRYDDDGVLLDCDGGADWLQTRCDYVRAVTFCMFRSGTHGQPAACCPIVIFQDDLIEQAKLPPLEPPIMDDPFILIEGPAPPRSPDGERVFDVSGRQVSNMKASGVYFIRTVERGEMKVRKVVHLK